jgi:very-short-patch-repair endonuclease
MGSDQNKNKTPNKLEALGYSILEKLDIKFIPQYVINNKFTVDAFLPEKNIVIQFDGDYWHGNKNTYSNPDHRQLKRMALDISQDAYMKKIGILVVRFWESEFKDANYIFSVMANL